MVHKLGNAYYGARSNEFDYANYELPPETPVFIHPLGTGGVSATGAAH
jgi:hypothetical protein